MVKKVLKSGRKNFTLISKFPSQKDQYLHVLALKETPVAVGILSGKDFIITFANPLFCFITGKKYKNIINKSVWEAIPEVKGQGFEELLENVLTTGIPYIGSQAPVKLKRNGRLEIGYFSFVFNPVRDAYGEATEIMVIASEVTDKVKIEKAVQSEREHFYEIFMQAPAVIAVLTGPNHIIDLVNPPATRAIGIKRDVVGKSVKEALPEISKQGFIEILDMVYKTGTPFIGSEIQTNVDIEENGTLMEFYYNFVFQPEMDIQGKVKGIFVYAIDVTEQVLSRRKIEDSEKRLTNILESISDAFIFLNKEWRYVYLNKEASKILGKTQDELIGKVIWDVFPEFRNTEAGKQFLQAARTGKTIFFQTFYTPFQRWFDIRVYPGKDGITTSFRDVTRRKLLEKQKEEFLGIASHELKTPVTSLKAFAQVLQHRFSKMGNKKSALLLGKMNGQINKLTNLIQDLLDVSKIESGKLQLHKDTFSLDNLIKEIVEEIQRTAETHKILIKDKTRKVIYGDKERIGQVLTNLLTNAVKYSPTSSQIIVSSSENKKDVTVCIKDFGIGISKENLPNIFDRFFRVSKDSFNTVSGMGLGLNIASEIIKRHNGRIWVNSRENKGSTFCFSLPISINKKKETA